MDRKLVAVLAVSSLAYSLMVAGVFYLAGTIRLPFFWAVYGFQAILGLICVMVLDPDLMRERIRPGGKDQDPTTPPLLTLLYVLRYATAALDVGKFHISTIPTAVQVIAFLLMVAGWAGLIWSMKVNYFFSSAIRLQADRGQKVISSGPYAYIRHPGYAFATVVFICECLALGSWLALIPTLPMVLILIKRTFMEEQMLDSDLEGYADYKKKVRYRWIPRIW